MVLKGLKEEREKEEESLKSNSKKFLFNLAADQVEEKE